MAPEREGGRPVCVTGASGFIASWLVKQLLERGYTVRGTVRDPDNEKKTAHLRALPGASERLTLVKADLLEDGSFDGAVEGCAAVFHTASPFFTKNVTDPQAQLLDPAVKGTQNVLVSCVKHKSTVRRVVLTSSTAAIAYDPTRPKDVKVDESCWSNADHCRSNKLWYVLSKTLAEKEAWKIAEEQGLELVTICPAMVVGDLLQPELNTSSEIVLQHLNGDNKTFGNWGVGWVHVEDVAAMHVLALEKAEANGRYLTLLKWAHMSTICDQLRKIEPSAPVPTECAAKDDPPVPPIPFDTSKAVGLLGREFKSLQEMLEDAVRGLKAKGFLSL